jgi:tRNA(Ile)-lysidine synthase
MRAGCTANPSNNLLDHAAVPRDQDFFISMQMGQKPLLSRVEDFLRTNDLLKPNSRLILAVSGGLDSMTMLHLFAALRESWKLDLAVAHVNHQLRGDESDADEAFVRATAAQCDIPFFSTRVHTVEHAHAHGLSKQAAARELRYHFFEELRQRLRADAVATAHTADDNAETVLMNALRGSGIHGLAGIPVRREQGNVIRPLLFVYRSEIEQYAREAMLAYRHDSSNDSPVYTRNLVRLKLMPMLQQQLHVNIAQSLNRLSLLMRDVEGRLRIHTQAVYDQIVSTDDAQVTLHIPTLQKQSPLVQDEILLTLLRQLGVEPQAEKIHLLLQLCNGQTGHWVSLSKSVRAYRDRTILLFDRRPQPEPFSYTVEVGKAYSFATFRFASHLENDVPQHFTHSPTTQYIDAGKVGRTLTLRSWRDGDWFFPFGLHGKKKVSDFFIDRKVPLTEKHRIPVLESNGSIVWVCGYRLDERFMITNNTTATVKLDYFPSPR